MINGWLNINKPEGVTSAHVLNRLKRAFPRKTKIGHAGTLDKFACGVLPVAIGYATKTIPMIMDAQKTYTFRVLWGVQTDTDDRDGDIIATSDVVPTLESIQVALQQFIGTLQQMPPIFSALKIDGKRASDRARKGEEVELESRQIEIFELKVVEHHHTETTLQMTCSKGTYVRALARDLAIALGTVAHVVYLRRDRVGRFLIDDAIVLEKDFKIDDNVATKIVSAIIPIRTVLDDIPAVSCTESAITRISRGQSIPVSLQDREMVFAVDETDIIATGFVKDLVFYPKNVFINGV
jgi:tRNA pseudouridine55 synthase